MRPKAPRLLVLIVNYPPDRAGGASVYGDMCQGLAAQGFDVTVRCAYPYYPEWKDKSGRNGWRIWRYQDAAVSVERYGLFIPRQPRAVWQRILHEASIFLSFFRGLPSMRRFDLVMAYCPAVSTVAVGACAALLFRKPLWLNVQDLAAQAAVGSGVVRAAWLGRAMVWLQSVLFNRAQTWSTISPVMQEALAPMRTRNQPLLMLPNWSNASLTQCIREQPPREPGVSRPLRVLYAGNIGAKQNLVRLLTAFSQTDLDFCFRVHGSGAHADSVADWVRQAQDPRFELGEFLDEPGFAGALAWADWFVISEAPDAEASFMPSKLIPAITAGLPILAICSAHSPLGREVREQALGVHLEWGDIGRLAQIWPQLESPEGHAQYSANATKRAQSYDRDRLIEAFAQGLNSLLHRPDKPAVD